MFSIAALVKAILLFLNAMAILSERRFLAPLGLASQAVTDERNSNQNPNRTTANFYNEDPFATGGFGGNNNGGSSMNQYDKPRSLVKAQIAQLLGSVRMLLRWPLIIINTGMIVFSLIFG